MTEELAKLLVEHNDDDLRLHESYSGRGMYGNYTTGVTGGRHDLMRAIGSIINHATQSEQKMVAAALEEGGFREDSMGQDMIFY